MAKPLFIRGKHPIPIRWELRLAELDWISHIIEDFSFYKRRISIVSPLDFLAMS
jgi:hypothetical protein